MFDLSSVADSDLPSLAKNYDNIVIWGRNIAHTHYWITYSYYNILRDLGIKCMWLDDSEASLSIAPKNSFYIYNSYDSEFIDKTHPKAFLAFRHNLFSPNILNHLGCFQGVFQHQQHLDNPLGQSLGCRGQVYYEEEERLLQQPWGTDLLAADFYTPTFSCSSRVYWTGSIWRQPENLRTAEWGNASEINLMGLALERNSISLVQLQDAYRDINIGFIRLSRLAPAIQGYGQVKAKHLACRFFKNISYGQFCVSNNSAAKELLGSSCIYSDNIQELIDNALSVNPDEGREMCSASQEIVRLFTIASGLARALALIEHLA
jgi:hypothetical protein